MNIGVISIPNSQAIKTQLEMLAIKCQLYDLNEIFKFTLKLVNFQ